MLAKVDDSNNEEQLIIDVIQHLNTQKLILRTQSLVAQIKYPIDRIKRHPHRKIENKPELAQLFAELCHLFQQHDLVHFLAHLNLQQDLSDIVDNNTPLHPNFIEYQRKRETNHSEQLPSLIQKLAELGDNRLDQVLGNFLEQLEPIVDKTVSLDNPSLDDAEIKLLGQIDSTLTVLYKAFDVVGHQLLAPYKDLYHKVWACQDLESLVNFVTESIEESKAIIFEIAAVLLLDKLSFCLRFQHINDPLYIELMTMFPLSFQREINGLHQSEIDKKPHLYQLDKDLNQIISQHNIEIINPHKNIHQDQDPVFFNLDGRHLTYRMDHSISYLEQAINNIKKDPRFLRPGSKPHLNQAGIELLAYAQKKLAEKKAQAPSLINKIIAVIQRIKLDFLAVYGFDGYEITRHRVIADIETRPYQGKIIPWGLIIASFFGLPTRSENFDRHDPPSKDNEVKSNYSPNFSWLQLFRNFIGGWVTIRDRSDWVWTKKKKWQIIFLPVKIFVILPIKIILVPFKFALNILKIFTELLPAFIVDALRSTYQGLHHLAKKVFAYKKAAHLNILPAILIGLTAFGVSLVFVLMNLVKKLAITLTSPEKSARMAFSYGRKFILDKKIGQSQNKDENGNGDTQEDLAFAVGAILAFFSILSTAILWAILLPLALSVLPVYFPAIMQIFNSILQWPLISSFFSAVQGILMNVGTFLSTASAFGSAVTFFAGLIGVQVSSALLIMSSALAFVGAPFFAILSRMGDGFSNAWARWGHEPIHKEIPHTLFTDIFESEFKSPMKIQQTLEARRQVKELGSTINSAFEVDRVAQTRAEIALNPIIHIAQPSDLSKVSSHHDPNATSFSSPTTIKI